MNQLVDPQALLSSVPIPLPAPGMTRYEKLMRWAKIVREHHRAINLFHGLEHWDERALKNPAFIIGSGRCAFSLALRDRVFADAGLRSSTEHLHPGSGSVADVMGFMELTQQQLHEFSCDCGGEISNTEMADRIERLA